ncbi:hypothetical protein COU36_03060 [Candidatus Micrarchaeota archaeon CG10_big_fil_rev_8_21_14_0_10_59_7]|nr:MAG: hypothetical protein COU36_03060 [Candidatus Micrarchaeota archaeon CG10_big_fil_rev_8_21_14_0_10_59_7]
MESVAKRLKKQGLNHYFVEGNALYFYFTAPSMKGQHRQTILKTIEAKKLLDAFFKTRDDIKVGTFHVVRNGIPRSDFPIYSKLTARTLTGRDYLEKLRDELRNADIPELDPAECGTVFYEEKFYMETKERQRKAEVERFLRSLPKLKKESPPRSPHDTG